MACKTLYTVFTDKNYNYPSDYKLNKLEIRHLLETGFYLNQQRDKWHMCRKISLFSIRATRKLEHKSKKKYW